jgi:hypothetical protein
VSGIITKENDMTQIFTVRAEVTVTYEYDVEADTVEEAVEFIEDGEMEDECVEIDSSMPAVTEYTIEGQMGWNDWEGESE